MDQTERYLQLVRRGRDTFVREAARAVLLRRRNEGEHKSGILEKLGMTNEEETVLARIDGTYSGPGTGDIQIYPLVKKPGAPFADMVMIGRTNNNDIVLRDVTISRFHAFFRDHGERWVVCDAGSKNGTTLNDVPLTPRAEEDVKSGDAVVLGDVSTVFYTAADLFEELAEHV